MAFTRSPVSWNSTSPIAFFLEQARDEEPAALAHGEDVAGARGGGLRGRLGLEDDELHACVARVGAEEAEGRADAAIEGLGVVAEIERAVGLGDAALA